MLVHRIKLRNLLSFGPDAQELEFKPLNVLIGPNGSGKSNLVELIGLLKAVPGDLTDPLLRGGPPNDWLWRGEPKANLAEVEVVVAGPTGRGPLRYRLAIKLEPGTFRIAALPMSAHGRWPTISRSRCWRVSSTQTTPS